jgi:hypothetical protein
MDAGGTKNSTKLPVEIVDDLGYPPRSMPSGVLKTLIAARRNSYIGMSIRLASLEVDQQVGRLPGKRYGPPFGILGLPLPYLATQLFGRNFNHTFAEVNISPGEVQNLAPPKSGRIGEKDSGSPIQI